jgi:hypothetical protein
MSIPHLNLEEGIMEIAVGELIIFDKAKGLKIQEEISLCSGLIFFTYLSIKSSNEKSTEELFLSCLILFIFLYQLLKRFFLKQTFQSHIDITEIKEISFTNKRFAYYLIGKIKLKSGKFREIKCTQRDLKNSSILNSLSDQAFEIKYINFSG